MLIIPLFIFRATISRALHNTTYDLLSHTPDNKPALDASLFVPVQPLRRLAVSLAADTSYSKLTVSAILLNCFISDHFAGAARRA